MRLTSQETVMRCGHPILRLSFDNGKAAEVDAEECYKWLDRANAVDLGKDFFAEVPPLTCNGKTFEGITTDPQVVAAVKSWLKDNG